MEHKFTSAPNQVAQLEAYILDTIGMNINLVEVVTAVLAIGAITVFMQSPLFDARR